MVNHTRGAPAPKHQRNPTRNHGPPASGFVGSFIPATNSGKESILSWLWSHCSKILGSKGVRGKAKAGGEQSGLHSLKFRDRVWTVQTARAGLEDGCGKQVNRKRIIFLCERCPGCRRGGCSLFHLPEGFHKCLSSHLFQWQCSLSMSCCHVAEVNKDKLYRRLLELDSPSEPQQIRASADVSFTYRGGRQEG